jgi:hypothetical protein
VPARERAARARLSGGDRAAGRRVPRSSTRRT